MRAQGRLDELLELAAQERVRGRKRTVRVELREQIADARQVRRAAKTTAREAKERAYATVAPPPKVRYRSLGASEMP